MWRLMYGKYDALTSLLLQRPHWFLNVHRYLAWHGMDDLSVTTEFGVTFMLGSELVLNIFVKIQSHKPLVAWSVISRHETKESRSKYNHSGQSGISSKAPTASRCWIRAVGDGPITILESASLTRASLRSRKVGMIAPASHNSARCQSFSESMKFQCPLVPTAILYFRMVSQSNCCKLVTLTGAKRSSFGNGWTSCGEKWSTSMLSKLIWQPPWPTCILEDWISISAYSIL